MLPPLPISTLFPYTTLFRSVFQLANIPRPIILHQSSHKFRWQPLHMTAVLIPIFLDKVVAEKFELWCNMIDRKSTRLNSSHQIISYAVFCLKKKKKIKQKKS